ncbi:MAG: branched-chain amino acid ABC transporter permease [Acidimicrobiia bacterium]|nr:branched-chain amino acid ABC transporter permease [Acidimicrobiia bacterium]
MRGRPLLYTSYRADQALLNTTTKKISAALLGLFLVLLPLAGPDHFDVPFVGFLGKNDWLKLLSTVFIFAVGALGLNLLTGLAGQVSLGHAFFMGVGAYTATWLGSPEGALVGLGLPMWIWLPAAGIVPALIGVAVGPTAVRVRGLYLAIVTLGLVFIGEYLFRNFDSVTGGSQSGRTFPDFELRLWKEETPLVDFSRDGAWFGIEISSEAKTYLFLLVICLIFVLYAKNIQRTRVGRAFQAIRDRDVAAEIMGVNEFAYKLLAFGISSFFAGVSGALLASFVGRTIPERWDLLLSVQFIAIILIGGAGTVSGTLMGASFVVLFPRIVQNFTEWLKGIVESGQGLFAAIADPIVATSGTDGGIINTLPGTGPGLSVLQLNQVIFGLLIIGFLIFEPLGLYGIWLRIRNYWKGWPFTY